MNSLFCSFFSPSVNLFLYRLVCGDRISYVELRRSRNEHKEQKDEWDDVNDRRKGVNSFGNDIVTWRHGNGTTYVVQRIKHENKK